MLLSEPAATQIGVKEVLAGIPDDPPVYRYSMHVSICSKYNITSKSPSSGRDPWGKDRRNCNADRGRTKWWPILRHLLRSRLRIFSGRAQTAKLSELDLPATPSSARVESEAPSRTNARVIVWTNKQTNRRTSIIILCACKY